MRKALVHVAVLLGVWTGAWAQSAIAPPRVGFIQDRSGSFRPVYGIAGNFLVGDSAIPGLVSAAFSGSFGWLKTDMALAITDSQGQVIASADAPEGPALFAFREDGEPALAYLPNGQTLAQWRDLKIFMLPFDAMNAADGLVLSIAMPDSAHAALVVQRDDGLWLVRVLLATGEPDSQIALPGLDAPLFLRPSGEVVATGVDGIVLHKKDGCAVHIHAALPPSFEFRQMGQEWLELRDLEGEAAYAVRLTEGREAVFRLPEAGR